MLAKGLRFAVVAIIVSGLILTLPCSYASAAPHGGDMRGGKRPGNSSRGLINKGKHYYRNGSWYRHGWLGFDIAVSALAIGALIDSLPPRHTTVVVAGTPYYYFDNYYYRPHPYGGYVVVPPPVLTQPVAIMPQTTQIVSAAPAYITASTMQPNIQIQDTSTINIPNSSGGYTAVTLKRSGNGYIGPQGEYYSDNPTVEQLKVLYGK